MTVNKKIPRLALTLGEPAGIGPDICLQIAQIKQPAQIVVIGSKQLLEERAKRLNLPIAFKRFDPSSKPKINAKSHLTIDDIGLSTPCIPSVLDVNNADYVIETLKQGYLHCAQHACDALVTGPVHKAIIAKSGAPFYGHTEFFAQLASVDDVLMTFYTPKLIVSLVTTHCPLQEVSRLLTPFRLTKAIELLHAGLTTRFNIAHPKIAICGLNPHAGEGGLLGNEEQDVMLPVINALRKKGYDLTNPLSADTIFAPKNSKPFDAILAMYHDQALGAIKALYFGEIVNITLGLPFLRVSVDHGTALELAGTDQSDPHSLQKAINLAAFLSQGKTS